ncbi:PhzF family isomerase [Clostridium botulinum]|nr:PhzF family isomerase [Clostridium botulinum]RHW65156.1 PhzF family isomerase [Clostridium botulinum]
MKELRIYQVDSFTTEKFKGNPAGVVFNADGLSDREMLYIARELNNSETAFILSSNSSDHDIRIRYFTPKTEVPVCGHATIAAHYVRAVENKLKTSTVLQKTGIGILPVEIISNDDDYSIIMTQGKIEFFQPFTEKECTQIVNALGLKKRDLDQRCPVQIVSTGHSKVIIGIKSRNTLNNIIPDMSKLTELSKKIGCNGYFIFTLDSELKNVLTHGRMFAPSIGINEDPVTGNANGPLGAYLVKHGLIEHNGFSVSFNAEQGYAINRSGIVSVTVNIINGEPKQIKIRGNAVIVFKCVCKLNEE